MADSSRLFFGRSAAIKSLLYHAAALALGADPILIVGEPGTGKTALAACIHEWSGRHGEFVDKSIAEIPESLLASALAGHRRGAFTGATEDRMGLVESARGGTIFLDEIDTASPAAQATLLRFLERDTVERLGETRQRNVGARFVVATNADIDRITAEGLFRRDLRDRFGCFVLHLPPLRERRDEILPLAERFVAGQAAELKHSRSPSISRAVREMLLLSEWSGNIRQLRSVCRSAALHSMRHSDGTQITPEYLPADFLGEVASGTRRRKPKGHATPAEVETALARCNNNRSEAARVLDIDRSTVHRIIERGLPGKAASPIATLLRVHSGSTSAERAADESA